MRDAGATYAEIGAELGVSKSTLTYWFNAASRERSLERDASRRAVGHSGSERFTPEAVAERRYIEALRRDPCAYCGGPGGTLDHIVPTARGGADEWQNLTGACGYCNSQKAHTPLLRLLRFRSHSVPTPGVYMRKAA